MNAPGKDTGMAAVRACLHRGARTRRHVRGVATLEYALILIFGMLPLILFTFTGVMMFAARQSLTLAAEEGARAAMRYAATPGQREQNACNVARHRMQWLFNFSGSTGAVTCQTEVLTGAGCGLADTHCMRVTTRYDYDAKPFLPGTRDLYRWTLGQPITSTAVAQLDLGN